ncbi:MAG: 16S rRNA (cytosine(1402)-N(4))-methyltransferase RsmH [Candidatus Paraimprobicoccus trichonymphae]|uniref:Ribosomal RNA small subunit methyltransferase H n=1 Tax=Candidatus Paraimprobicoccus trichonymphae TaxID=3033793 RepID=A0AA48IH81_9FIRM|nr:MAG: 16S rRNA (cytosine(1402)-N(4))-methyltransferase RsmH [Candidatus Paraimprobicoccus trichonymphae]
MINFIHKTVLLEETINYLDIKPDGIYLDATVGGGGCSEEIISGIIPSNGKLICIDQDPDAIQYCKNKFSNYKKNVFLFQSNFSVINKIFSDIKFDGIVLDLGVSSYQIDTQERGFSYKKNAILDMRMSKSGTSAREFINKLEQKELSKIIKNYGEEKYHKIISNNIIKYRRNREIKYTLEFSEIVKNSVPFCHQKKAIKTTFQAFRIYVNSELENLKTFLDFGFKLLKKSGRICILTFHSLEDRIVKQFFLDCSKNCNCPKEFPICVCGKKQLVKIITKKPIIPSLEEINLNPRSKSAKLRVYEKIY